MPLLWLHREAPVSSIYSSYMSVRLSGQYFIFEVQHIMSADHEKRSTLSTLQRMEFKLLNLIKGFSRCRISICDLTAGRIRSTWRTTTTHDDHKLFYVPTPGIELERSGERPER